MRLLYLSLLFLFSASFTVVRATGFTAAFEQAYLTYPNLPKGLLEGVAFAQTRITHITGNNESCSGLPQVCGVMGLTEDGQGYFNNNLLLVAGMSGIPVTDIKNDPGAGIMAYAHAFSQLLESPAGGNPDFLACNQVLQFLSELPSDDNPVNAYALDCFTYEVFRFMNDPLKQAEFDFPDYSIDLPAIYGETNYAILTAETVTVDFNAVSDNEGNVYESTTKSLEYGPALWVATPSCNYSSRAGTPVSAVTVHTIQGTYAGAISWAQNCSANVSYHYVARSSDGQITQMVYEADKAWHVGTENPYTIGIEHEGYVSNPAWYTEAMYVASANLVKDICTSGYGINPLRTFQGPASSGSNVLGSCTKIKGHQHYPNQTHTDPGIYWNWEHYYQLINDNPGVINYTASAGVFYDSGGAGANYNDDERQLYLVEPSGVVNITLSFQEFNLETDWDYLYIYDGASVTDPLLGVYTGTTLPSNVSSTGGSILVEFRSDCSTTAAGWQISWSGVAGPVAGDVIPPSTSVSFPNTWKTSDFQADFTDTDNPGGSGILNRFYQVIDYDGTEWRANPAHGFYSDNFDVAIHPEWTVSTGSWNIVSGYLRQSDQANTNTNIYASLNQDDHDQYLYHWAGKIGGSGTNKRAGFHFMCDDAALPNRGNSYFVWFREDDNKVQIYKVVNDVFTLEADQALTINPDQWYDIKVVYDKITGEIRVWVNDVLAAGWTDISPYVSGNAISFRSGDAVYDVNDLKVYHNRSAQELITVGPLGDIRYQNPSPLVASAKVKSIAVDSSSNISSIASQLVHVDWTVPADIPAVSDGTGADIAVTFSNTELSANWLSSADPHSSVERYWYAIGTSPGATDVVNWTDNWFDTIVTHSGLSLVYGTTYYVSVKAENGAGLLSDPASSDGQLLDLPVGPPTAAFDVTGSAICSTDSLQLLNSSNDASTYSWSVPGAVPATSSGVHPYFQFPASGTYEVTLIATGPGGSDTVVQLVQVEINPPPQAAFSQNVTVVSIDNPFVVFTNNSTGANGYSWDFGDGNISSDAEPWHAYAQTGIFNVLLVAINGACPNDTAWSTVTVVDNVSLDESFAAFAIYPNPVHETVQLIWPAGYTDGLITLDLLDAAGKLILHRESLDPTEPLLLDIRQLNIRPGTYFIRVTASKGVVVQKLVVE